VRGKVRTQVCACLVHFNGCAVAVVCAGKEHLPGVHEKLCDTTSVCVCLC